MVLKEKRSVSMKSVNSFSAHTPLLLLFPDAQIDDEKRYEGSGRTFLLSLSFYRET